MKDFPKAAAPLPIDRILEGDCIALMDGLPAASVDVSVSVSACTSVSVSFSDVSAATAPAEVDAGSSFLSFLHPAKEAIARNARIAAIVLLSFIFLLFRLICFIAINLTIYICNQYKYSIAENLFVSSSVIIGACERYS